MSIHCKQTPLPTMPFLLLSLEVVQEDRSLLRLLTPVLDDDARAVDNLACISLTVQHTCDKVSDTPSGDFLLG